MKMKDEVSKLQYANAVYIERIAKLEEQNSNLFKALTDTGNAYKILYHNVDMIFGSTAYLSLRGARLPKDLVKQIRALVDNYDKEYRKKNDTDI